MIGVISNDEEKPKVEVGYPVALLTKRSDYEKEPKQISLEIEDMMKKANLKHKTSREKLRNHLEKKNS